MGKKNPALCFLNICSLARKYIYVQLYLSLHIILIIIIIIIKSYLHNISIFM